MKKTTIIHVVVFLAATLLITVSCSSEISDSPIVEETLSLGLSLERGINSMSGDYVQENMTISFDSMLVRDGLVELEMTINGKEFLWYTDFLQKAIYMNGYDAVLSAEEKIALQDMAKTLYDKTQAMNWNTRQDTFAGTAAVYWADAPAGYVHSERNISNASVYSLESDDTPGKKNVCVKNGDVHEVIYDMGDGGQAKTDTVEVGSDWGTSVCGGGDYSCMGRCGGGCGGFGGGITLDCLEHDVCSHNECATGGGSDYNCGDEYDEAADDIAFWGGHRCDGTFSELGEPGCGNGIVESGEECDDDSECCSSNCEFVAEGTSCSGGECDGSGDCESTSSSGW